MPLCKSSRGCPQCLVFFRYASKVLQLASGLNCVVSYSDRAPTCKTPDIQSSPDTAIRVATRMTYVGILEDPKWCADKS
jgi:hypothetical protein